MLVRLNKYMKDSGLCSRRKADEFIEKGYVSVNGETITELGFKVDSEACRVELSPEAKEEKENFRYILLYKPRDFVTTKNDGEGITVFDIVPDIEGLTYAGRLDKDSEGLLILSNDGEFVYRIANPDNEKEKEYEVIVDHDISEESLSQLRKPMQFDGKMTKPAKVVRTGERKFSIILKEGLNRQIRRMAGKVKYNIISLRRIRIGIITVGNLKPGKWRDLTEEEIRSFD